MFTFIVKYFIISSMILELEYKKQEPKMFPRDGNICYLSL